MTKEAAVILLKLMGFQMVVFGLPTPVLVGLTLGLLLFLLKKSVRAKVRGCEHFVLRHLSKRRLEWAFCLGGLFTFLFLKYHSEMFKLGAEVMSVPAMESLLSRASELE